MPHTMNVLTVILETSALNIQIALEVSYCFYKSRDEIDHNLQFCAAF